MIGKFGQTSLLQDPESVRECGRDGTHLMNLGPPLPVLLLKLEFRCFMSVFSEAFKS